jgi:hypothetical protein
VLKVHIFRINSELEQAKEIDPSRSKKYENRTKPAKDIFTSKILGKNQSMPCKDEPDVSNNRR